MNAGITLRSESIAYKHWRILESSESSFLYL